MSVSLNRPKHHHGQLICNRYLLQGVCGRGGGGVIYKAFDLHTQNQVALKLAHHQASTHIETLHSHSFPPLLDLQSPPQEYRLARQISHPQIIQYLDAYIHDHRSVMVMEYVDASSFSTLLHPNRIHLLSRSLRVEWIHQLCQIVDILHQHEIIHCDLKPQNLLCLSSLDLKLIDFGIALSFDQAQTQRTSIRGTPFYMAPEQFSLQTPLSIP